MAIEQASRLDPVTLEVVRNALPAITNEMSIDMQRTSYNMMIYEVRDYCCALLDVDGRLISQNIGGVSHFVADLGDVIKDGVAQYGRDGFHPGDVVITNHQRVAGQHLNNMCVYTPVFYDGELFAFAVVRAHWVDVGGMSTGFGGSKAAIDPWLEGLQLDQIKLYNRGEADPQVFKIIRDNIRYPESSMGDLRSQLAACRLAERRLEELLHRYGRETVLASIERIFDETEAKCRAVVERIPDGEYEAEAFLDHDGVDLDQPIVVNARVVVRGGDMTIDLTKCSKQRRGPVNARTRAAAYIAYKGITAPLDPVNEGSFRALKVEIKEGSFMMASYPATMSAWSVALPTAVDVVLKALAQAMPDRIPAAHLGNLGGAVTFFGFDPKKNRRFVVQSIEGGGWGGRPWGDGESASVSVCQGDVRNAPVENVELKCPVLIESRALRMDSGGAGRFRGGLGLATQVRNLVEGHWNLGSPTKRKGCPPWGLWGGKEGDIARQFLRVAGSQEFESVDVQRHWVPGDSTAILMTPGGGGWGDPLEREPERVREDVIEGYVSITSALEEYGVVLDPTTLDVDQAATADRGEQIRLARMQVLESGEPEDATGEA